MGARLALRSTRLARLEGQKQAFGFGEVAPSHAPGFGEHNLKPAESLSATAKYLIDAHTNIPAKKEIIEAIGYPGQRHSAGCVTTVGRIYYGPGRYDYGRPVMPKGWMANYFYGFWEFGHLMFVADRWTTIRCFRHLVGILVCFFPMWLQMQWNVTAWQEFKKTHAQ